MKKTFFFHISLIYLGLIALAFIVSKTNGVVGIFSFIIGFFAMGWLQYALVQAMHESVHQFYKQNDGMSFIAALAASFPLGFDRNYREVHLSHHQNFGDPEKDPDHKIYSRYPTSKAELFHYCWQQINIWQTLRQFLRQTVSPTPSKATDFSKNVFSKRSELFFVACTQILILGFFFLLAGHPFFYLTHWLLPLFVVVKLLTYFRLIAEHGDPSGVAQIRSFTTGHWGDTLISPFGFSYHGDHHKFANIPYTNLPEASAKLREQQRTTEVVYVDISQWAFLVNLYRGLKS